MDAMDAATSLLIVETSEWFDWLRAEVPLGGLSLPDEETAVLFIERALHLVDRVRGTYRHVPDALRYKFIRASIIYQCWEKQMEDTKKAGWNRGPSAIPTVIAVSYASLVGTSGRHHLVNANDGFQYVITLPNRLWTETMPATEMICNRLAILFGLGAPSGAIVSVNARLLRLADANSAERPEPTRRGSELCCGFRFLATEGAIEGQSVPRRCMKQVRGALVFDIWTLNSVPRGLLRISRARPGQPEVILADHSHCLAESNWDQFGLATVHSCPAPQWVSGALKSLEGLWPWVLRAAFMDLNPIWETFSQMPPQWYGHRRAFVASTIEKLSARRGDLIPAINLLARNGYFPSAKIPPSTVEVSQKAAEAVSNSA
jgi:hypothetical protein